MDYCRRLPPGLTSHPQAPPVFSLCYQEEPVNIDVRSPPFSVINLPWFPSPSVQRPSSPGCHSSPTPDCLLSVLSTHNRRHLPFPERPQTPAVSRTCLIPPHLQVLVPGTPKPWKPFRTSSQHWERDPPHVFTVKAKLGKPENTTSPTPESARAWGTLHSPEPGPWAPQPPWGPVSRSWSRNWRLELLRGRSGTRTPPGCGGPWTMVELRALVSPRQNGAQAPGAASGSERGRRASAKPGKECGPSPQFRARRPVPRRRPWIVITTRTEAPTLLPSFPVRFPRVARKAEPTPTRRPRSPSWQYRRQQNTSQPCYRKSRLCLKEPTEARIFWAAIGAERMHRKTDFWVKESVADIQPGKRADFRLSPTAARKQVERERSEKNGVLKYQQVLVAQSCPPLWPMACSPPGSSVRGTLQARILEWVDIPASRESPGPRDWTRVSCIAIWAIREVPDLLIKAARPDFCDDV